MERIGELVASGAVRTPEIKTYPLAEAAAAHRVSEAAFPRKTYLEGALADEFLSQLVGFIAVRRDLPVADNASVI
jgi:hypothetical protein